MAAEINVQGEGFNPLWLFLALLLGIFAWFAMSGAGSGGCEWNSSCPNQASYTVHSEKTGKTIRVCAAHYPEAVRWAEE